VELNGEVGFAFIDKRIELWMLKQEKWVLHCEFDVSPPPYDYTLVVSGCVNKDGDILLTSNSGRHLYIYTLKTGDLWEADRGDICVQAHIRMYRKSLLSIRPIADSKQTS
jgi:hypothetical protein